ncbi:hypothetical protein [Embleya sp. NBC_00896]|uniref:hypothetical protein n=1 Tax=Embleya sp. NBC_00896 TaxID=2975961 RepID=UPI00386C6CF8|nr:hypothetical protein OG928_31800 [Embleya sp. NBC_00896]
MRQNVSAERYIEQQAADGRGDAATPAQTLAGRVQRYAEDLAYLAEHPDAADAAEVSNRLERHEAARHVEAEAEANAFFAQRMERDGAANAGSAQAGKGTMVMGTGSPGSYRVHSIGPNRAMPQASAPPGGKAVKQPLGPQASAAASANAARVAAVGQPSAAHTQPETASRKGTHIARPPNVRTPRPVQAQAQAQAPTQAQASAARGRTETGRANAESAQAGKGTVVMSTGSPGSYRVHTVAPDRTGAQAFVPGGKAVKQPLGPQASNSASAITARLAAGGYTPASSGGALSKGTKGPVTSVVPPTGGISAGPAPAAPAPAPSISMERAPH